VYPE